MFIGLLLDYFMLELVLFLFCFLSWLQITFNMVRNSRRVQLSIMQIRVSQEH